MKKVIRKGSIVTKVLIWNKVNDDNDLYQCELTFNCGSKLEYSCDNVDVLENENKGIYELLEDGTYIQIEDWE